MVRHVVIAIVLSAGSLATSAARGDDANERCREQLEALYPVLREFAEATGRLPSSLDLLADTGFVDDRSVLRDPRGPDTLHANGFRVLAPNLSGDLVVTVVPRDQVHLVLRADGSVVERPVSIAAAYGTTRAAGPSTTVDRGDLDEPAARLGLVLDQVDRQGASPSVIVRALVPGYGPGDPNARTHDVQPGDRVLAVAGRPVEDLAQVQSMLATLDIAARPVIEVVRRNRLLPCAPPTPLASIGAAPDDHPLAVARRAAAWVGDAGPGELPFTAEPAWPAGIRVSRAGDAARRAGIANGDMIESIEMRPVQDPFELQRLARAHPAGTRVIVRRRRGEAIADVRVVLETVDPLVRDEGRFDVHAGRFDVRQAMQAVPVLREGAATALLEAAAGPADAEGWLSDRLGTAPSSADPQRLMLRAGVRARRGALQPALEDYEAAITALGDGPAAWSALVGRLKVLIDLGEREQAWRQAREWSSHGDPFVRAGAVDVAEHLIRRGHTKSAETLLPSAEPNQGLARRIEAVRETLFDQPSATPDDPDAVTRVAERVDTLITAADAGDLATVEGMLGGFEPVDGIGMDQATALLVAAGRGHDAVVAQLLAGGADPDQRYLGERRAGGTPLTFVAVNGHRRAVQELLRGEADIDARVGPEGATALTIAAARGHAGIVEDLVLGGATVDASIDPSRTENPTAGYTPLMMALRAGHEDVASVLLRFGADPGATAADGRSPAILAEAAGAREVGERLAEAADRLARRPGRRVHEEGGVRLEVPADLTRREPFADDVVTALHLPDGNGNAMVLVFVRRDATRRQTLEVCRRRRMRDLGSALDSFRLLGTTRGRIDGRDALAFSYDYAWSGRKVHGWVHAMVVGDDVWELNLIAVGEHFETRRPELAAIARSMRLDR